MRVSFCVLAFLDASSNFYKRVRACVRPSVRPVRQRGLLFHKKYLFEIGLPNLVRASVRPCVRPSVRPILGESCAVYPALFIHFSGRIF